MFPFCIRFRLFFPFCVSKLLKESDTSKRTWPAFPIRCDERDVRGETWELASHLVLLVVVDVAVAGGITWSLTEVVIGGFHQQVRLWLNMRPVARQLAGGGGEATPWWRRETTVKHMRVLSAARSPKHCAVGYKIRQVCTEKRRCHTLSCSQPAFAGSLLYPGINPIIINYNFNCNIFLSLLLIVTILKLCFCLF